MKRNALLPLLSPQTPGQVARRVSEIQKTKGLSLQAGLLANCLNFHSPFLL